MGLIETLTGGRSDTKQSSIKQLATTKDAVQSLVDISKGPLPDVPLRGIAELPEKSPERALAGETATDLAAPREAQDILSLPEVQAIIQVAQDEGNLQTNRLARILQSSGSLTSTPGRDALGRTVGDIQARITERLTPFGTQERGFQEADKQRRQNLIPILTQLGLIDETATQQQQQNQLDAIFSQELGKQDQLQNFIPSILQQIISSDPGVIGTPQAGRPGLVSQVGAVSSLASLLPGLTAGVGGLLSPGRAGTGGQGFGSSGGTSRLN